MRVYRGIGELPQFKSPVVSIGSFDGIHLGHRAIIERVQSVAKQRDGESVVITFEPHPRVVLGLGEGLRLLTTLEEKIYLLERMGVDNLIVIPFDRELSLLSYRDFVASYLIEKIKIDTLVVGYDHHIGRNNEGRYSALQKLSEEMGFQLSKVEKLCIGDGGNLSSTVIRSLISRGDMQRTKEALSHPYLIMGQCDSDGRVWINTPLKLIPASGVYSVEINDKPTTLEIDQNGVMTCQEENKQVVIKFGGE